jgi:hypothetical protein
MTRLSPVLLLLVACGGEIGVGEIDTDTPDTDPPDEEEDLSRFDDAILRIVTPRSGDFLPLEQVHTFEAEVRDAEGEVLGEVTDIAWTSNVDAAWAPVGARVEDDTLAVGRHDLTAEVTLPNGDRLAHTVGGVLLQSEVAGTYVGSLSAGLTFQQLPLSCAGSAVLVVDAFGETVDGTAECLARAGDFELPLDFTVTGEHLDGPVEATATATIIAFDLDFPAEGELDPAAETLELDFGGQVLGSDLDASIRTTRLNRDAGL